MYSVLIQICFLIIAYLLGSIPWALIISKLVKGIDLRDYGSKNLGATNTFRVLGFKWGLLVYMLDALKGALIVAVVKYNFFNFDYSQFIFFIHPLAYGIAAFIGHLFPIFLKFKGGKGVSTTTGIVLAYAPLLFISAFFVFVITIIISKYVSLSSCVTLWMGLILSLVLYRPIDYYLSIMILIFAIFITIKHIPNFIRIKNHTESKINFKAIKDNTENAFINDKKDAN